jgi:hypothetical protein
MKVKSRNIFLIICLLIEGCSHTEKASTNFVESLNSKKDTTVVNVLSHRVFHHIEKESYHYPVDYVNGKPTRYVDTPYLEQPVFFFENKICLFEASTTTLESKDLYLLDEKSKNYYYGKSGWGVYDIDKDTVKAIIYIDFWGGRFFTGLRQRYLCNFQGIIKNNDTILQWRLIPPFPPINMKISYNVNYIKYLKKPLDLYYKNVPAEKIINPSKAWINKYKIK